ncbi:MAG: LacI family DNA-binding transcriptional regulator [Anaerolineae bacterium]
MAKLADVSLSTVSLVLNNKPNVTAEMRERVLGAAVALGYRQKIIGHSPMMSGLSTVGLLTKRRKREQLIVNPFYSYVIDGVEHASAITSI